MASRQRRKLFRAPVKVSTVANQDRTHVLLRKSCESRFEIPFGTGIHNNKLAANRARRRLQVCDGGSGIRGGWVCENAEHGSIGHQLAKQLQSFWRQLANETGAAGKVRA